MDKDTIRDTFAVMSNAYCRYPFSYFLDSMERLGLKKIDLWGGSPHFYAPEMTGKKMERLLDEITGRGMELTAYTPEVLAYAYDIASSDPKLRRKSVEYFKLHIEIADALGIPVLLVVPGRGEWDTDAETTWELYRDSMAELGEYALQAGIMLGIEQLTKASSHFVNHAGDLKRILTDVPLPSLAPVLDVGQMSLFGETVEDFTAVTGQVPLYVHMMDGNPALHLAFGDGNLPLEKIYRDLAVCGYRGTISLEINDRRYFPDPHAAIEKCLTAASGWGKEI